MKNRWRYFAVVIAITIMFLSNTVNVAFSHTFSKKIETQQGSLTSETSGLQPNQTTNELYSGFKDKNKQTQMTSSNFWRLTGFGKDASLDGTKEYSNFGITDANPTELVIGVDDTNPQSYASLVDAIGRNQGKIVNTVSITGKVIALVADMPLDVIPLFRDEVQRSGLAAYTEPNMKFQAQLVPNDPYWSLQWGPQKIEADWAWNTTMGDSSVLVAIIDTGIDYSHPDLAGNYVPLGYDWVNMDNDPIDDFGHGTHCAGIVAASINNGVGIAGVAHVSIMAEKGLDAYGSGYEDELAQAIIHAVDQGADILSNSWGSSGDSMLIHEAVQYAYNHSVLVIAAAGNSGSNIKMYPAAYDEVVAVTATDSSDNPAYFTNYGDWVEVAAPGVDIYSTMPTYHVTMNDQGYSMNYTYMSGTSMACPHAAGVAALIWSQFPNATRDWVRAQLRFTADDLGDPGFDEYYGFGRINAKNAVEQSPPDHDLLIFDWNGPQYLKVGVSATFNITVLNFGTNSETDVEVRILVNSSPINSTFISLLEEATSTTVSLSWTPTLEGTHNVTFYVLPAPGETIVENNQITEILYVITPPPETNWMRLATDPDEGSGMNLKYIYGQVYSDIVYFKVEYYRSWTTINDIDTAILIDADQDASTGLPDGTYYGQNTGIGADYLIVVGWEATEMWKWDPVAGMWDMSNPIPFAYLEVPENSNVLVVGVFFVSLETSGIVDCAVADIPSNWDWMPDSGSITWSMIQYEHEIAVMLDTPLFLIPGETSLLNATVCNRGLNNETNVEIQLTINGSIVADETLIKIVNGTCYTINYSWTPTPEGVYNVTAYAPPVSEENFTLNNIETKFVSVHYPLINPEPGQYANYFMNYYDASGNLISYGFINFTYEYYVEPYKIYISVLEQDPSGYTYTLWMVVNTMTRLVESGNLWTGYWYPGWIETNIGIGSTINLLDGAATVNGTEIVSIGSRAIDCWEMPYYMYGYPYAFWYDKATGLWIRMESVDPYTMETFELLLADTNVPIGTRYEHDLGVTLDVPTRIQPSETSTLKATVHNLGLNNESNVELRLLLNGTEVASETLTNLVNGTWYTINYSWTPTTQGTYNITAYTPPVPDENVTINNIVSRMVNVRYIEVALISDQSDLMLTAPILDSMGIGYDIYNSNSMYLYTENLSLLLSYKAVIFSASSRWITSNEYSALEFYLSSGGSLLVTGFDCLVSDTLLANLVRSSSTGDDVGRYNLIVVDDTHPIMNGPYGSFPSGYIVYGLMGDCDHAEADTARNAVTVAELEDGYDKIIATEGLPGRVVFWNGVGAYDWIYNIDCEAMLKNIIHWFTVRYQHDISVSLQAPAFLEPSDSTILNATVQNSGLSDEANINLQLLINGTLVEDLAIPLLTNGTSQAIHHPWTPIMAGTYNVTVYAPPVSGENITLNNIYTKLVPVKYAPRILAYVQYADYSQEYSNTLRAITSTFGPNYYVTELWNYNELGSMIMQNDILLIPEQENADPYTLENIGIAWSATLSEFLDTGGIIIVCDFNWGSGGTYSILNGAGLMLILSANYRTGSTLYLADPTDPLAEGVPPSFTAPDGTISFVTGETNVVISDGNYPVVIHKKIGPGQIALLGFDFYSFSNETERILGNAVALASAITISINPSSGSLGTEVLVTGTKATVNGTVSIYWDSMLMGNTIADEVGNFTYLLTVPLNTTIGNHEVMALDTETGRADSTFFRVLIMTLNPNMGPVGTKVTLNGAGFTPESQVTITFNDMLIGYASVDDIGNFTFAFNVPFSSAGTQLVNAYSTVDAGSVPFTVVDVTPLDVQIDVGEIHFRGEIAEFCAQTSFKGKAVNATITSAVLYRPDETTVDLTAQLVATGLYKLSYTIPADATTGTYTLVIDAEYTTDTVQASGTSFKCFLISPTLTYTNAYVVEIKENIATVVIPDLGAIKLNLTAMNVTLSDIFLKVIAINGTTATIQTTIGIVNGTVAGTLSGDMATIVVPGLGEIQADISSLKETQEAWIIPQYAIIVIALIAAAGATISVILLRFRKTAETK
jgi:thermitase